MIILNKIKKEFADKLLFEDVNLTIYDGERVGIIGSNGSGKSTLMNIISGDIKPDFGNVKIDGKIDYVKQASENLISNDFGKEKYNFQKISKDIGLNKDIQNLKNNYATLSGGEKTKLAISQCLSKDNECILLDEPTNNLDYKSIEWLIEKINSFNGTVIVISHDRYFLNKTVNKIIEIENGKLNEYYGDYDAYEMQKKEALLTQKRKYDNEQLLNRKIEKQIEGLKELTRKLEKSSKKDGSTDKRSAGYKDSVQAKVKKIARAKDAKITRLEKLKENRTDKPFEKKDIFYNLVGQEVSSKLLIKFDGVSKSFDKNLLFENVNLIIENHDKVALVGDNGTGKTTLLKMIMGEESCQGSIWKSSALNMAYLTQDIYDLKEDMTVIEFADRGSEYKTQFLTNLSNMGITRQLFSRKISTLSLGERMKIKLNEVILGDFNLLILDEPTNHMDIENKKFLEDVLKNYKGSLIIVSHDRALIKNVCNKIITIENKTLSKDYL